MKATVVLRAATLLAAGAFPLLASAQFQQPTPDELKMTSDPKAPGAAAVYLNIEETADDNLHYRSYYARIKVLTEKGKELATVSVPYVAGFNKVTDIKARTIHPDGTVIPLEGKAEDLLTAKAGDVQFGHKVFTLPSVEVGSILEYKYELRYPDENVSSPQWDIQQPYYVHKAHYLFIPFKSFLKGSAGVTSHYITDERTGQVLDNLIWWTHLPAGSPGVVNDAAGHFTLDVTDIPAAPDEEYMPPIDSVLYKVVFYYKGSYTAEQFWSDAAKRWSKEADHFADPSKAIRAAVDGIVAPTDSGLEKATKLYTAVQALDNTDYSREKSESEMKQLKIKTAKRAEDTWAQKSGNSQDIALLYLAMLRAAGLKAWALKVKNRDDGPFDPTYMYGEQFDDTLVILENDGKQIMLDPGEKMCPFDLVSWRHSEVGGMRQSASGASFTMTPAQMYTDNTTVRQGDITLDEHGAISGRLSIVMTGQSALHWRQIALRNDIAEVKKQFDHELEGMVPEGVEAHLDHFLAMDQPDSNLLAIVNVKGTLGAATAKRLLLPGFFFESRGHVPFVKEEKRMEPVDMHYAERLTDQVTYHLPGGMTVEGAPANGKVAWQGHAVVATATQTGPGQIVVARSLARGFSEAKPEEYQDLRGFYQKVAAGDQQEIVLRAAAEMKGN